MRINIRRWLSVILVVLGLVIAGCSNPMANSTESSTPQNNPTPAETTSNPQFSNLPRLDNKATVELRVKGSPITIEVDGTNAPITAGNFVDLVQKGVYDGLVFHRVVREPQPFVVQGGDPQGKNPKFPVELLGTGGFIDPQTKETRYIPLEIKPKGAEEPIYRKTFKVAGINSDPQLTHTRGAVAMARSQMPDSASSQFYFALAELPFLDGDYAVFGYVTKGMDVVNKIQQGDRIESVKVIQGIENLKKAEDKE
ncbi:MULTISPECIES: peptidylprolyl isomerase [Moorena]|uniref:Peptidyl-prolyl cis-trans isomerase n=1 Tax=Moorena producens 3L TaxID=489825 RepID=F4XR06_9CYAN|nr:MULTISPECIES: peptidylprolyl isomerase [Moorena]NEQ12552.1 peptidylprolyl isomerase [Moorena sp. SIO3E2]NES86118.1 peptidylprolyl isomerase [Moorena sp. SIO2B7]EGJ32981.1 peptidyl-prolyl cis-trans isomerase, cyclophilin family [Moorena producens 3L]NEP33900.1 peptidylprolyl isomerase [Moorena sp. SIO3B2]NEP68426.1 peptidylprolyl isomerase [Moorena sp. SIO3A5]